MCKERILDFFDLAVLFAAGLVGLILVYAALFFLIVFYFDSQVG